jgi:hypothetical protein
MPSKISGSAAFMIGFTSSHIRCVERSMSAWKCLSFVRPRLCTFLRIWSLSESMTDANICDRFSGGMPMSRI